MMTVESKADLELHNVRTYHVTELITLMITALNWDQLQNSAFNTNTLRIFEYSSW